MPSHEFESTPYHQRRGLGEFKVPQIRGGDPTRIHHVRSGSEFPTLETTHVVHYHVVIPDSRYLRPLTVVFYHPVERRDVLDGFHVKARLLADFATYAHLQL